jgi:uncharacterized protein
MLKVENMKQIKEERIPIVFENEGQKLFGIFHRPEVSHRVPGVLVCHGLAGHKTGRYRLYVSLAAKLVQQGIAVFRFDFRGAGDSEGEFVDTTVDGQISDALKAFHILEAFPSIDTTRMGLFGRSFGGAVGVMAAQRFNKIKSIALWAPMFNANDWMDKWKSLKEGLMPPSQQKEAMRINGQQGSPHFFEQFFQIELDQPMHDLSTLPLLHIQGEKDDVINIHQAEYFEASRKKASGKSKFIRLPNGDHHFSGEEEQQIALNATIDWFTTTL